MAFKAADLAIKLNLNDVPDNGYKAIIFCGQNSADIPTTCGGTNAEVMLEGAISPDKKANLRKLKEALAVVMAEVDSRLAQPVPPPPPAAQPNPDQPGTPPRSNVPQTNV